MTTTITPSTSLGVIPARLAPTMRPQQQKPKQRWTQSQRRRKVGKRTDKKKKDNNNQTIYDGLVTDGIMKGMTISPGSSARITSDFRLYKKLGAAYAAAKGYKHWLSFIEILKSMPEKQWKTKRPNKSQYEGTADIMKQE